MVYQSTYLVLVSKLVGRVSKDKFAYEVVRELGYVMSKARDMADSEMLLFIQAMHACWYLVRPSHNACPL